MNEPSQHAKGDFPVFAPARVRVKICGITTPKDAEAAIAAGADAMGFNAWKGSKRYLDVFSAAPWIGALPGFVSKVVLCVNHSMEEATRIAALPCMDLVQFHGEETLEFCAQYAATGRSFLRAVRIGSSADLESIARWGTRQVLLDAAVPGAFGGTGSRMDIELAAKAVEDNPRLAITLAGGLDPENVAEAVRKVRPYAVDVASGVECAPGKKDPALMRDFVEAVRSVRL